MRVRCQRYQDALYSAEKVSGMQVRDAQGSRRASRKRSRRRVRSLLKGARHDNSVSIRPPGDALSAIAQPYELDIGNPYAVTASSESSVDANAGARRDGGAKRRTQRSSLGTGGATASTARPDAAAVRSTPA